MADPPPPANRPPAALRPAAPITLQIEPHRALEHGDGGEEIVHPLDLTATPAHHLHPPEAAAPLSIGAGKVPAYLVVRGRLRPEVTATGWLRSYDGRGRLIESRAVTNVPGESILALGPVGDGLQAHLVFDGVGEFLVEGAEIVLVSAAARTRRYVADFDARRYALAGSDFVDDRFDHGGLTDSADTDPAYTFDFELLAAVERRLLGIDRPTALRAIFDRVTQGAATATEQHLAIVGFVQKAGFHNDVQPVYRSGFEVMDPLVCLELGELRCSHANRLAIDLMEAGGHPGRFVQFASHQAAEIYYDGRWHYLDADIPGGGAAPRLPDGTIPSVEQLSATPLALDALPHYRELRRSGRALLAASHYPAWFHFSEHAYSDTTIEVVYYLKRSDGDPQRTRFYGWDDYVVVPDRSRRLHDLPHPFQPGAPWIDDVRVEPRGPTARVRIDWADSADPDGDVLGYRVYVGTTSRGWAYEEFAGAEVAACYQADASGWRPEMYDALFTEPPHDVGVHVAVGSEIELEMPACREYFVSIAPFDAHGESVGKTLYHTSSELRFDLTR